MDFVGHTYQENSMLNSFNSKVLAKLTCCADAYEELSIILNTLPHNNLNNLFSD